MARNSELQLSITIVSSENGAHCDFSSSLATHLGGQEILCLSGVSSLLHCSQDTVRRIPKDELPAYRVGKSNLYLRDEVIRYVRTCRIDEAQSIQRSNIAQYDVDDVIHQVLDSATVDAGEPSLRRVK